MFKWLLFLLIVYLLYRFWHQAPAMPRSTEAESENMMRCELCGLHFPEHEAVREGEHVFCSEQHRASWKQGR